MEAFHNLTDENCKFRFVSTSHLPELRSEIETRRDHGEFEKEFAQRYLCRFKFTPPAELKDAKSLIVVAMPRPITKAIFGWRGKKLSFILPPTYTAYDEKRLHVERLVAEAVGKEGFKIATPLLPLKLLASRSGLVQYGRNNITYSRGFGSFMRLTAVYSDMPCESDSWEAAKMMERCRNCDLCQRACPTGAISSDRFLLHAEKCLTFHNEKEGKIAFPNWIKPEWHNCIVGCIRCQAACPEDKPFLSEVGETAEFTEQETKLLLQGTSPAGLPSDTLAKMKALSLMDYFDELPRNLSVLLR
ncbi:MAG TPA: 4Fe-4S double cluster binding domain-containing protein [Candidatus Limnocylindrales bacterium]|nr:4Fe-4S double cluster binding domain-containing protein [Candidatus Limnocylindrales bacterium]